MSRLGKRLNFAILNAQSVVRELWNDTSKTASHREVAQQDFECFLKGQQRPSRDAPASWIHGNLGGIIWGANQVTPKPVDAEGDPSLGGSTGTSFEIGIVWSTRSSSAHCDPSPE